MNEKSENEQIVQLCDSVTQLMDEAVEYISTIQNLKFIDNVLKECNFPEFKKGLSENSCVTIAFSGQLGEGKSTLINILLNCQNNYPLKTSGAHGKGCTQKPLSIYLKDTEDQIIIKGFISMDEPHNLRIENPSDKDQIARVIENFNLDEQINYIEIDWPSRNDYLKDFLEIGQFRFIDLVGYNDKFIDASEKNKIFVETIDEVDCIVLVKRSARGQCNNEDIEKMYQNSLFKKCSKYSAPFILVISSQNAEPDNLTSTDVADVRNSIIYSISEVFGYKLPNELNDEYLKARTESTTRQTDYINICHRDNSCNLMISNCNFLKLITTSSFDTKKENQLSRESKNEFFHVLKEIKAFKKRSLNIDRLNQLKIIFNQIKYKIHSTYRKQLGNNNRLHNELNKFFKSKSYKDLFEKIKLEIQRILDSILEDENENREFNEIWQNIHYKRIESSVNKFTISIKREIFRIRKSLEIIKKQKLNDEEIEDFNNLNEFKYYDLNYLEKFFCNKKKNIQSNLTDDLEKIFKQVSKNLDNFSKKIIAEETNSEENKEKLKQMVGEVQRYIDRINEMQSTLIRSHFSDDEPCQNTEPLVPKTMPFYRESSNANKFARNEFKSANCIKINNQNDIKTILENCKKINLIAKGKQPNYMDSELKTYFSIFKNSTESSLINIDTLDKINKIYKINFGEIIEINFANQTLRLDYKKENLEKKIREYKVKLEYFETRFHNKDNEEYNKIGIFQGENPIQHVTISPIFMWCKQEDSKIKMNQLLHDLKKSIFPNNMLIFLVVEKKSEEFEDDFSNLYLTDYSNPTQHNPIISVFIQEKNLEFEKVHRIIMMLAEHFSLNQFFIISENIGSFLEFNGKDHVEEYHTCSKTLVFMSKALNENIKEQKESKDFEKYEHLDDFFSYELCPLFKTSLDFRNLRKLVRDKKYSQAESILFLIEKLKLDENFDKAGKKEILTEFKDFLIGPHSKTIGTFSLVQQNDNKSGDYTDMIYRLRGRSDATHTVNKIKNSGVVLYNLNAVKQIHPITNEHFFGKKLDDIYRFYNNKKTTFGDLMYYYYMLNFSSNATVYYFCYNTYVTDATENVEPMDEEEAISPTTSSQACQSTERPIKRLKSDANKAKKSSSEVNDDEIFWL